MPLRAFLLAFLLLVTACGGDNKSPGSAPTPSPSRSESPAYGDAIIDSSIADASNLIPILASDSASHGVSDLIYNGLVKYDRDYNIIGDLAESWEISADGLTITFHLRDGVTFHDGHPLTSEDVMFSYQTVINPDTPTAYEGDYLLVTGAENPDPLTFVVHYDQPFAPALISWSLDILPKHLLEGQDLRTTPLARNPVGSGPFKFKEWTAGDRIFLETYPDYFEGRAYLDTYIMRIIPDQETQFLELKAGGIDWMGLTPVQWTRQTETPFFKQNFRKYQYLANGYAYLGYNLKDKRFSDKRVRQAFSYAIKKDEIIEGVLLGLGVKATGPYKPGSWVYNPDVRTYDYNLARAKKLLAEAGWEDTDGDGWVDKNGQPFSFTIQTNQGNELRRKTGEIIIKNLADLGVKADLQILEWAAFIKEFVDKGRFETIILGWNILQDPDLYDVWHSSKTAPGDLNFIGFENPEVDALLEKGRHTFDQAVRKECYDRFQEILAEVQPLTFLYVPYSLQAVHSRFKGIEPAPAGISYNFIRWYVPPEEQRYHTIP